MRRLLVIAFLLANLCAVAAPPALNPDKYVYPISGVSRYYSANFGEMRPGHFHAGIDIKTEGVEGRPLVAVADGYISRVVLTSGGYGRAVYLTMPDGKMAVYGHLLRFTDDIEAHVRNERRTRGVNGVDLYFDATQWPVRQGDIVGYSGDSGSSKGPHLHFEMRDNATQWRHNMIREGMIRPVDNIPPHIMKLHYMEIDTVGGVAVSSPMQSYDVEQRASGIYALVGADTIAAGRRGYFVAEVSDRRNNVHNTFGIWRLTASVDDSPYFEYRMDGFVYDESRCCDAVSFYPLQLVSRNECIRLARLAAAPDTFYPVMRERGVVRTAVGEVRRMAIEVEDDMGNISRLKFAIRGRDGEFDGTPADGVTVRHDRAATLRIGDRASAYIPAGAVYEPVRCCPEMCDTLAGDESVVVLTPAYQFVDVNTPLRRSMSLTFNDYIPSRYRLKTLVAVRNAKGKLSSVGGGYSGSAVRCSTRSTGPMMVVADTLAPTVGPRFKDGADLSRAKRMEFTAEDNFAGVASWRLMVDGERIPSDRYPLRDKIIHFFDVAPSGMMHTVELSVTDRCGNTAKWKGRFYR